MKHKKLYIVIVTVVVAVVIFVLLFNSTLFRTPSVGFYGVDPRDNTSLVDILEGSEEYGKKIKVLEYDSTISLFPQFKDKPVDLLFVIGVDETNQWKKVLEPIDKSILVRFPTTFRSKFLVPLELDHVELAYDKKIYGDLVEASGVIGDFTKLEELYKNLAKKNYYPLMISGGDDKSLLDAISLFSLSILGKDGYTKLKALISDGTTLETLLDIELENGKTFRSVLDKLKEFESLGILHPEWLKLSEGDSKAFLKQGISSSVIMRLSTHRKYPAEVLRKLNETLFPFYFDKDRGTGMVTSAYTLGINSKSFYSKKSLEILTRLYSDDNQRKITYQSGLAPVTYTAEAMDKQSSNVRLWGASSLSISNPIKLSDTTAIKEIREYLE